MALKFKVVERGEPGVTGGGTKKYPDKTGIARQRMENNG